MAENKDGQEKTESATAKRLNEARNRGQVSKSMDVTTAAILLVGGSAIFIYGNEMFADLQNFMKYIFSNSTNIIVTEQNLSHYFFEVIVILAQILLPILLTIFAIIFVSEISQVGFKIATEKFTKGLNFKQIFNPFSGMKRMFFSGRSLFELAKGIAKLLIIGYVVYDVLASKAEKMISLVEVPFGDIAKFIVDMSFELILKVGIIYILIAAADFFYQRYRFKEDMKMTKQEVKEEGKQAEGDPKVKARIRALMRGRIRRLMLKNVKQADVVITNPTHFAVALMYKQGTMSAPRVVAKGADFLALQIREIAEKNDVTIVEQPPLARALFYSVEIEQEIPEELFKAVAQVLAFVYNLKRRA